MMLERRIRKAEAFVYRYPVAVPVRTSFGTMHDRPAVFIRIEDSDGAIGWGEAWCNFPTVGAEHRARLVNELIAPLIVERAFESPRDAFDEITDKTAVLAIQSGESGPVAQAIAGIDIALWDLAARRAGKPLWSLLGGSDPRVAVYASGINPDQPKRTIGAMRARGHSAFKLKVGFGEELDERNVRAIREEFGHEIHLAVDANQAWDVKSAMRQASRLEAYELSWIEEPLRADRPWSEWNDLRRHTKIPLAAGENIAGLRSFSDALAKGVFTVVQPDAAKWGGVTGCLAVGRMIREAGATYCPHYLGGGIGLLASAHLLAAIGGGGMLEVDVNENPLRDELCGPLHDIRAGYARLSDQPGLGPVPEMRKLRRFRIREQPTSVAQSSYWRKLLSRLTPGDAGQPYEPSKHYMRGPGPKARAALLD